MSHFLINKEPFLISKELFLISKELFLMNNGLFSYLTVAEDQGMNILTVSKFHEVFMQKIMAESKNMTGSGHGAYLQRPSAGQCSQHRK